MSRSAASCLQGGGAGWGGVGAGRQYGRLERGEVGGKAGWGRGGSTGIEEHRSVRQVRLEGEERAHRRHTRTPPACSAPRHGVGSRCHQPSAGGSLPPLQVPALPPPSLLLLLLLLPLLLLLLLLLLLQPWTPPGVVKVR